MKEKPKMKMTMRRKLQLGFWLLFIVALIIIACIKAYYLIQLSAK